MEIIEAEDYLKDRKHKDKFILDRLDKKVLEIAEKEKPLGKPLKHMRGVWGVHIGKRFRLYYKFIPGVRMTLLRFLHKDFQDNLKKL